jgi:hypothetical protein
VRTSKTYVSDAIVVTIVSALKEYDETCSRLNSASFAIILQTLLHANYSRQKERGILLLTVRLLFSSMAALLIILGITAP